MDNKSFEKYSQIPRNNNSTKVFYYSLLRFKLIQSKKLLIILNNKNKNNLLDLNQFFTIKIYLKNKLRNWLFGGKKNCVQF